MADVLHLGARLTHLRLLEAGLRAWIPPMEDVGLNKCQVNLGSSSKAILGKMSLKSWEWGTHLKMVKGLVQILHSLPYRSLIILRYGFSPRLDNNFNEYVSNTIVVSNN